MFSFETDFVCSELWTLDLQRFNTFTMIITALHHASPNIPELFDIWVAKERNIIILIDEIIL